MKWIEFILENFKPGTATEVARHIEEVANAKGFKPHNHTKMQSVFKLLPEHTRGVSRPESNRIKGIEYFVNIGGVYYKKGDVINGNNLILNSEKKVSDNKKTEKIYYESNTNKSIKHNEILSKIKKYMDSMGIENEVEYRNIDLVTQDDEKINIFEIKSYEGSEFKAMGQLLFYKHDLSKLTDKKIQMNFVSNYKQNSKYTEVFDQVGIKHINVNDIK